MNHSNSTNGQEADITPGGQTHLDELSEHMDWLKQ
jgi:hypothetical protein